VQEVQQWPTASWSSRMKSIRANCSSSFTLALDGHHVETAEDGREALELLAERSYDVILSNLRMPASSQRRSAVAATSSSPRVAMAAPGSTRSTTDSVSKTTAGSFGLIFHRPGSPQSRHTPESFVSSLPRGAYS
jgi:DNA-binding NtrC family response regulator